MGCNPDSSPYMRTAPTPTSEASDSITQFNPYLASLSTGAHTNASLSLSKACYYSGPHTQDTCYLSNSDNGAAIVAKPWI